MACFFASARHAQWFVCAWHTSLCRHPFYVSARSIHGILPNVAVYHLLTIGTGSALLSARTVPAKPLQGCCGRVRLPPLSVWYAGGLVPVGQISRSFLPHRKVPWHKPFPACAVRAGVRKDGELAVLKYAS